MTIVNLQANIDPSYYRLLFAQERGRIAETFEASRPSVAERLAAGKALREKVPRTSHATYEKPADRPDPVGILEQQNVDRIAQARSPCAMPACWPRPSPSCAARRR